ncbi:MAG: hypothetical protein RLN72_13700 [Henriciella sp.]
MLRYFGMMGLSVIAIGAAAAPPCTETSFSAEHGQSYLTAEKALIEDDAPEVAVAITGQLLWSDLNCFEKPAVHRLRAASLVELGKLSEAAEELEPVLHDMNLPAVDRAELARNIGLLFQADGQAERGQTFLDMALDIAGQTGGQTPPRRTV